MRREKTERETVIRGPGDKRKIRPVTTQVRTTHVTRDLDGQRWNVARDPSLQASPTPKGPQLLSQGPNTHTHTHIHNQLEISTYAWGVYKKEVLWASQDF